MKDREVTNAGAFETFLLLIGFAAAFLAAIWALYKFIIHPIFNNL